MKTCRRCGEHKPLTEYYKHKRTADGYRGECKSCIREMSAEWTAKNKERYEEYRSEYRKGYRERHAEQQRTWREANRDKARASVRKYQERNPHVVAKVCADRRATKNKATVSWDEELTSLVMREAFALSRLRQTTTEISWHVDHIVPLRGGVVCGLHVWNNIQVITADQNMRKNNRHSW